MRRAVLAVVVTALPAASIAGPSQLPILGGTPAQPGDFPTVVAVEIVSSQGAAICTGTLIHPEWVMTAAHCVKPSDIGLSSQQQVTAAIDVRFDSLDAFSGGMLVAAADTMPKPEFSSARLGDDDIGLIRIPAVARLVQPINRAAAAAPIGVTVTFVGYGETGAGAGREYVLAGRTSTACASVGESDDVLLCFDQTDGRGQCHGDSGGPTFTTIDGVASQIGVTSFGDQNCQFFGAETRVDAEVAWLDQIIGARALRCVHDGVCATGCPGLARDLDCPMCSNDDDCAPGEVCDFAGSCLPEPYSPGGLGSACTGDAECLTGACRDDGSGGRCTSDCTGPAQCPSGFECLDQITACWPGADGGGCATTGGGPRGAALALALFGLVLARRRRRA